MHADGQRARQPSAKNDRRWLRGNGMRHRRWMRTRVIMSLPACRQRALDRIEQTLVAEDPGLGSRFAVFARLTRHEAIPGTEQVPGRVQQVLRRAAILPLVVISVLTLLAATGLIPARNACSVGRHAAAAGKSLESRAAGCQPGPAVKLDQMRMH
jgi:hypothetical protein